MAFQGIVWYCTDLFQPHGCSVFQGIALKYTFLDEQWYWMVLDAISWHSMVLCGIAQIYFSRTAHLCIQHEKGAAAQNKQQVSVL